MKWQFWKWLFKGIEGKSGISGFLDKFLFLHISVAILLSIWVDMCPKEAASTVLLPLSSIFIGLSFAWAGNAQALMQTDQIKKLATHIPDGIQKYVYSFQLSILVILVTLSLWGLAGLGVFQYTEVNSGVIRFIIECILYFMASITLRECWHVVMGSQAMLLMRHHISTIDDDKS